MPVEDLRMWLFGYQHKLIVLFAIILFFSLISLMSMRLYNNEGTNTKNIFMRKKDLKRKYERKKKRIKYILNLTNR